MRKLLLTLTFVLFTVPATAQISVVRRHFGPEVARPIPPTQIVERLRAVAGDLNSSVLPPAFGILRKTAGANCVGYACDIICHVDGRHWDVLIDAEQAATPDWRLAGSVDPARCDVGPIVIPPPPPPVDPLKPVLDALTQLIEFNQQALTHLHDDVERMEKKVDQLDTRLAAVEAHTTSISNQLVELQARPFPEYRGRVVGWPVTLKPRMVK